jgi:hypothetical protein
MGLVHPDFTTEKEHNMAHKSTKTKALIATAGLIGLGVLTAGTASASTTPAPAPSTSVEAPAAVTPEVPGAEAPDATEVAGSETEGVDDGNDGGHEDADGVDIEHEGGADEL